MFVEGLFSRLTFVVAEPGLLTWVSLKVCSFWDGGKRKAEVRHRSYGKGEEERTDELLGETPWASNATRNRNYLASHSCRWVLTIDRHRLPEPACSVFPTARSPMPVQPLRRSPKSNQADARGTKTN